jgi:hypothetical protein
LPPTFPNPITSPLPNPNLRKSKAGKSRTGTECNLKAVALKAL